MGREIERAGWLLSEDTIHKFQCAKELLQKKNEKGRAWKRQEKSYFMEMERNESNGCHVCIMYWDWPGPTELFNMDLSTSFM